MTAPVYHFDGLTISGRDRSRHLVIEPIHLGDSTVSVSVSHDGDGPGVELNAGGLRDAALHLLAAADRLDPHIVSVACRCEPEVIAPGVHQHRGPTPRNFVAVLGDDITADGFPTEIHQ